MTAIETVVGGLSNPSKMPGKAFGFSPKECITGSKLRLIPGSVCSDCYACKGCYQFATVTAAHMRRFAALRSALNDPLGQGLDWARAMVVLIGRQRVPFFRWHDAGDVQSVEHLALIAAICRRTPHIRHWLPTREYRMVREYLARESCPENLVIRLSAHMRNETIPVVMAGCVASAVYDDRDHISGPLDGAFVRARLAHHCPASKQGGQCGDCRACWSLAVPLVIYPTH